MKTITVNKMVRVANTGPKPWDAQGYVRIPGGGDAYYQKKARAYDPDWHSRMDGKEFVMTGNIELPPLPEGYTLTKPWDYEGQMFTEGQMKAYATAAIEADRKITTTYDTKIMQDGKQFVIDGCGHIPDGYEVA